MKSLIECDYVASWWRIKYATLEALKEIKNSWTNNAFYQTVSRKVKNELIINFLFRKRENTQLERPENIVVYMGLLLKAEWKGKQQKGRTREKRMQKAYCLLEKLEL